MTIRATLRPFTRDRWFTITALLTIALGIGTNIAIFSLLNRVLLAPLPYRNPERIVWIATWNADRGQYSKSSGFDYDQWKGRRELFESVEAFWDRGSTLTNTAHPEALVGWQFTPGLFPMLGVPPALGRTFGPGDAEPGRDNVVVLSDGLWRRRFGADPRIAGTLVELDGTAHTIAGVMPPTFTYPYSIAQIWTPLTLPQSGLLDRKQRPLRVFARLRDGVTRERAEVELRALAERFARKYPDTHAGFDVAVRPLRDFYVGDSASLFWILQATAFILLLIAASNVASLVLVRANSRERETAVRVALGAGRLDLLRQHLTEGFFLSAVGGAAGLVLAVWGTRVLPQALATRMPGFALPSSAMEWWDSRVVLATIAVVVAIGIVFGCTPLLRRSDALTGSLRAGARGATGDRRTQRVRNVIVASQVALSVLLLVGAGLLVRSFARLQDRSFGFSTDRVVTAQLLLPRDRYQSTAQIAGFLDQLVSALGALPGVESAAAVNTLPLSGSNALRPHNLPGQPPQERLAEFRLVTPAYFRTLGIPLRRGRLFDDRDRAGAPDVIVVNETAARRLWPNADPIGQILMVPDLGAFSPKQVVGVVGDTRHHDLARDPEPEIYRPAFQTYWPFFGIVIRTNASAGALERSLRDAASSVDRNVPISNVRDFTTLAEATWAWRRGSMALLIAFAIAASFLAFVGVYGVMAYSVSRRSREIGVRVALGARPSDVARAVIAQGAWLTGFGVAAGLILAALAGGVLKAMLFHVSPLDPATFALVSIVAAAAGLGAAALPAISALRVDPAVALRGE
ncbi:MAG TPA: ABC transporter permease [Vicinamibacterales bacterium]|jgi:putative ABC transport system permease protein